MKKLLIIIPARIGSKRLKKKNILPIKNLPMVIYVAKEALKSKYKPFVYVSSESSEIINFPCLTTLKGSLEISTIVEAVFFGGNLFLYIKFIFSIIV